MRKTLSCILFLLCLPLHFFGQTTESEIKTRLEQSLTSVYRNKFRGGRVSVDSIVLNNRKKTAEFYTNQACWGKLLLSENMNNVLDAFSKMTFLCYEKNDGNTIRIAH